MSSFVAPLKPLSSLCGISKDACFIMSSMVLAFYSSLNGETAKLKADKSVFTIADGIVQHMLIDHLFKGKFHDVIGEEDDSNVNIKIKPYTVDELVVPDFFYDSIDSTLSQVVQLSKQIDDQLYQDLNVFIDPIDGTREFSTGLGEQCSICIGFSDSTGKAVAGVVYRPIPQPNTWAAGVASEDFFSSELDISDEPNPRGFLTSNGGISPFISQLITELGFERVPSGGAGNKMLMLLEGKGACYIQDRGVSRWDTCGAQAVLEAKGGICSKLSTFLDHQQLLSEYTYLRTSPTNNLDFVPNLSLLTPFNAHQKPENKDTLATTVEQVKPYSNLCGLLALCNKDICNLNNLYAAMTRAAAKFPPAFD